MIFNAWNVVSVLARFISCGTSAEQVQEEKRRQQCQIFQQQQQQTESAPTLVQTPVRHHRVAQFDVESHGSPASLVPETFDSPQIGVTEEETRSNLVHINAGQVFMSRLSKLSNNDDETNDIFQKEQDQEHDAVESHQEASVEDTAIEKEVVIDQQLAEEEVAIEQQLSEEEDAMKQEDVSIEDSIKEEEEVAIEDSMKDEEIAFEESVREEDEIVIEDSMKEEEEVLEHYMKEEVVIEDPMKDEEDVVIEDNLEEVVAFDEQVEDGNVEKGEEVVIAHEDTMRASAEMKKVDKQVDILKDVEIQKEHDNLKQEVITETTMVEAFAETIETEELNEVGLDETVVPIKMETQSIGEEETLDEEPIEQVEEMDVVPTESEEMETAPEEITETSSKKHKVTGSVRTPLKSIENATPKKDTVTPNKDSITPGKESNMVNDEHADLATPMRKLPRLGSVAENSDVLATPSPDATYYKRTVSETPKLTPGDPRYRRLHDPDAPIPVQERTFSSRLNSAIKRDAKKRFKKQAVKFGKENST